MTPFGEALIKARKRIASGQNRYICFAFGGDDFKFRDEIRKRLESYSVYEHWVKARHPDVSLRMTHDDYRQGRLQWMDYMIEQERLK